MTNRIGLNVLWKEVVIGGYKGTPDTTEELLRNGYGLMLKSWLNLKQHLKTC